MAGADAQAISWPQDIFDALVERHVSFVVNVPDAGHDPLLNICHAANETDVITLTTEQDGIGMIAGAWAGGRRGVLLMQSSGVGNCVNALALPQVCRVPFLTIVSMRGEWGEFVPWQVPMGQATPDVLRAMQVTVMRADFPDEVGDVVAAGADLAFQTRRSVAVLLSQRLIGAKKFKKE